MSQRLSRLMVAALALILAVPVVAACDGMSKALDCAKIAARIAGDVQDLQSTATNIGQLSDGSRRQDTSDALSKIQKDLQGIGGGDHADVHKAVGDLSAALTRAKDRAEAGKSVDVTSIADAAGQLTVACPKS